MKISIKRRKTFEILNYRHTCKNTNEYLSRQGRILMKKLGYKNNGITFSGTITAFNVRNRK